MYNIFENEVWKLIKNKDWKDKWKLAWNDIYNNFPPEKDKKNNPPFEKSVKDLFFWGNEKK
jgi:hypothetical protein